MNVRKKGNDGNKEWRNNGWKKNREKKRRNKKGKTKKYSKTSLKRRD